MAMQSRDNTSAPDSTQLPHDTQNQFSTDPNGAPGMLDTDMIQPEQHDYPMSGNTTRHQIDATATNPDTTTSALDEVDEMDDDPDQAADAVSPTGGLPIGREWMRGMQDPLDDLAGNTADDLINADDMDERAGNVRIRVTRKGDEISDYGEADPEVAKALAQGGRSGDV